MMVMFYAGKYILSRVDLMILAPVGKFSSGVVTDWNLFYKTTTHTDC